MGQPVFYYDLGNPECYLAAERIMSALPAQPEWEPVLERDLDAPNAGSGGREGPDQDHFRRRAEELGLLALRWPASWPPDTRTAMLAATYAKGAGRAVAFSLAAFRQAFAGGQDLGREETVLIAAAACEMHPTSVLKGISLRSTGDRLTRATARAAAAGVTALPAIQTTDDLFAGADAVDAAAYALGSAG